jgi:hypothetical protein
VTQWGTARDRVTETGTPQRDQGGHLLVIHDKPLRRRTHRSHHQSYQDDSDAWDSHRYRCYELGIGFCCMNHAVTGSVEGARLPAAIDPDHRDAPRVKRSPFALT